MDEGLPQNQGVGGASFGPGSREPSPSVSAASGFDPSRGDKPFDIEDLVSPIIHAIRFAYTLERKHRGRNIPWRGPGLGKDMRATCPDFVERFRAGNLRYVEEDQGRDALTEIVIAAVQLGIEQGRRITLSGAQVQTKDLNLKLARMVVERLASMEAFTAPRACDARFDEELLARIEYARKAAEMLK